MNTANNMNEIYIKLMDDILGAPDRIGTTRKGEKVLERFNYSFTLTDIYNSFTDIRNASWEYLNREFEFYASGSDSVEEAAKLSKFWNKCTDDEKTINSNYGKLLLHDKNAKGRSQLQHAVECLFNNIDSKKAVMTLYSPEHAYISNDNPCSMFLHLRTEARQDNVYALHMTAFMRSNDIWFGTVYDVPYFCSILHSAAAVLSELYTGRLQVIPGTYTHFACNLHAYERNFDALNEAASDARIIVATGLESLVSREALFELYDVTYDAALSFAGPLVQDEFTHKETILRAWEYADLSSCLKKKCGAVLLDTNKQIIGVGWSGREHGECATCARDEKEVFYSDGCYSVHAEMRAIMQALEQHPNTDWSKATLYTTHGPCDACMKLMDYIGIGTCVYDVPYKTDYSHYPRVKVLEERVRTEVPGKSA